MIGVTGLGFFATNIFSGAMSPVAAVLGTTPLMLAVFVSVPISTSMIKKH